MSADTPNEFEIFNAAREITEPRERQAYIARACGTDAALRQKIVSLLKAYEKGGDTFDQMGGRRSSNSPVETREFELPGARIGRYKLLEKIGEGGCGVVYLAEQEEPVRRRVALKIIKLGMDSRQVVARFEAERQALALMDHANIAKFFDAGITGSPDSQLITPNSQLLLGRPYFVMELVGGIKITDYCEQNNLTTQQRLDLFIPVCSAIQHAHQKGIIHRDIKPSNVLVAMQDGVAVPKIIDFGIAKATQGRLTDDTVFTAFEQFLGTPAYMSPEQAQLGALDVDTRSDIYSLGVLLYELLTGKTPFDTKELLAAGLDAMRRTIQEKEPPTPSTRLKQDVAAQQAQSSGQTQIKNQKSKIANDLDWIVMKCLEKDRARRYETANGLARDIERHLGNEPVVAGPPSNLYRLQKLVQRNKVLFASAGAVTVALILGLGLSTWSFFREQAGRREQARLRQQAETEAAKSQQVARLLKEMLQGVGPAKARGRDTTILREILDKTAERIDKDLTNQPEVEIELRNILASIYQELALYKQAQDVATRCLELACARFGKESLMAANALQHLGAAQFATGNLNAAEKSIRQALEIRERLLSADDPDVAASMGQLALLFYSRGEWAQSEAASREALAVQRKRFGEHSRQVADSLNRLSSALYGQGRLEEAEATARDVLALRRELLGEDHPDVVAALGNLGSMLREQGKFEESEARQREALALNRKLLGEEHPDVATVLGNLAVVLDDQGKLDEAEALAREALERRRESLGNDHPEVAKSLDNLAQVLSHARKLGEAEVVAIEALALRQKRWGTDHPDVPASMNDLADIFHCEGRFAEANELRREALTLLRNRAGHDDLDVATLLNHWSSSSYEQEKWAEAEELACESLAIHRKLLGGEHPSVVSSMGLLGSALLRQGKYTEAERLARECMTILEKKSPDDFLTFATQSLLGGSLLGQMRYAEAEPLLRAGYEGMKQRSTNSLTGDQPQIGEAIPRLINLYNAIGQTNQAAEWRKKLEEYQQAQTDRAVPKPATKL
jgi:serine/threonine protein kinase/tetratricopeptide (TPR) repeat protein